MNDQFIFGGNRHATFPTALLLDKRLTPLERNVWQVVRIMLEENGMSTFPSYEQLQPYLASTPLADKASTETIAKALIILRLTGWLSLAEKHRNENGTVSHHVYILHDRPLALYECLQFDGDYLELLSNSSCHASKAIQKVAKHRFDELSHDPHLANKKLPTRLEILTEQLTAGLFPEKLSTENASKPKTEVSAEDLLRIQELTSDSETSVKAADSKRLRNPKSLCSSSNNKKILLQGVKNNLKLPKGFTDLSLAQQKNSLVALSTLSVALQQQALDEWQRRCELQTIHNPAAYLYGIIQKALQGELNLLSDNPFNTTMQQKIAATKPIREPVTPITNPVDQAQAKQYLHQIKLMLKGGSTPKKE